MNWLSIARPKQITPEGNWFIWILLAGRGFGKSRTASEDLARYALSHPGERIAVVSATTNDLRKVCFEGDSGILNVIPPKCVKQYNISMSQIELFNGALIEGFSAEKPDRLRGPQFHRAYCDELASWQRPDTFDMLMFGLRLGKNPQCVITTTPRPTQLIKDLMKRSDIHITRGSTFDNKANLAPSFIKAVEAKYDGTRLGRQELYAEILDDNPGALWKRDDIDSTRVSTHPELLRIVVAIDPAVTNKEDSDETGIIVAGIANINGTIHGYILDDVSMKGSPDEWARKAVQTYHHWKADRIIGETNNGGDMIETVIRTIDPSVSYKGVHASRGKLTRAEPISALYEQHKVHHVGMFPQLEDSMCEWDPVHSTDSPDRMDACLVRTTLVKTNRGDIRICDVTTNDYVLTRKGWRKVTWAGMTRKQVNVIEIEFSNGARIIGTGEHPVYVENKDFVRLDSLVCGDIIYPFNIMKGYLWKKHLLKFIWMGKRIDGIQTRIKKVVEDTTSLQTVMGLRHITGMFGRNITELYQRAIIFIIKMVTSLITTLAILNVYHQKNIHLNTQNNVQMSSLNILSQLESWQQNGIRQKKVSPGIENTAKRPGITGRRNLLGFVGFVVKKLLPTSRLRSLRTTLDTVRENVIGSSLIRTTNMMWKKIALLVVKSFGRTNISLNQKHAAVSVTGIYERGKADVYNLHVDGVHEFYANGVLVHNCVWALTELMTDNQFDGFIQYYTSFLPKN